MPNSRNFPELCKLEYEFNHPVDKVWPWVVQMDDFNTAMGFPHVDRVYVPDPHGGSSIHARSRLLGRAIEWTEPPREWQFLKYFWMQWNFLKGPFRTLEISIELVPTEQGCRVTFSNAYEPTSLLSQWLLRLWFALYARPRCRRTYDRLAEFLNREGGRPMASPWRPNRASTRVIQELAKRLSGLGATAELTEKLARIVLEASDRELGRIRPLKLARDCGCDPLELLSLLFRATKAGLFSLSWDLICPSCRGPKIRTPSLLGVSSPVHCQACNLDYDVEFDRSIELTFMALPEIRAVRLEEDCLGNPAQAPHVIAQRLIRSGTPERIALELEEGEYLVRSLQSEHRLRLVVDNRCPGRPAGPAPVLSVPFEFKAGGERREEQLLFFPRGIELELWNNEAHNIGVSLERDDWVRDVCSAAFATTLQEFRDLFATEALKPGQEIHVGELTILFTDLKDSTAIYDRMGDEQGTNLVRDHFKIVLDCVRRNRGAVIKTIGDAVMATFACPKDSLTAAVEMHRELESYNLKKRRGEAPLFLKVGLHRGSCSAVSLNDRLEFLGTNVNIAARTLEQCSGGDVALTLEVASDPAVRELLGSLRLPTTRQELVLKGFREGVRIYRIECVQRPQGDLAQPSPCFEARRKAA